MSDNTLDLKAGPLRARALAGDDEALEMLCREALVPVLTWALGLNLAGSPPQDQIIAAMRAAVLEAVILWQPEREPFSEQLDRCARRRIFGLFQATRDLLKAAGEVMA